MILVEKHEIGEILKLMFGLAPLSTRQYLIMYSGVQSLLTLMQLAITSVYIVDTDCKHESGYNCKKIKI